MRADRIGTGGGRRCAAPASGPAGESFLDRRAQQPPAHAPHTKQQQIMALNLPQHVFLLFWCSSNADLLTSTGDFQFFGSRAARRRRSRKSSRSSKHSKHNKTSGTVTATTNTTLMLSGGGVSVSFLTGCPVGWAVGSWVGCAEGLVVVGELDGAHVGAKVAGAAEGFDEVGAADGDQVGLTVVGFLVGALLGLCVGEKVGLLVVGALEGCKVGGRVGVLEGELVGWFEGLSVGGVGEAVLQCPLSRLQAALAHGRSHTLLNCKKGEHPGAQSSFWRKTWATAHVGFPYCENQHGFALT